MVEPVNKYSTLQDVMFIVTKFDDKHIKISKKSGEMIKNKKNELILEKIITP